MTERVAKAHRGRLEKKIAAYVAAAGAALATAASAEAGVVYTDVDPDASLSPGEGYSIDFDGDANVDVAIVSGWDASGALVSGSVNGLKFAAPLQGGYAVGSGTQPFLANPKLWDVFTFKSKTFSAGFWPGESHRFLGVRFDISGNLHYGWVEMSASEAKDQIVIHSYAYETDADTPILTPQVVPEPSSLMLFALGAGGVAAWRARRRKTAKS